MISKLDFVGIPSQDAQRSRQFYVETLGLRGDDNAESEVWAGETCFAIWEPKRFGMEFAPQKNAHPALHVDDVAAARADLEGKGVEFAGDILDTGVCHMAFFTDPDGNDLMLHHRYAARS
jgi:catechol 2,3-dioxygenase-like lactoylglutathione lyase family enzyme